MIMICISILSQLKWFGFFSTSCRNALRLTEKKRKEKKIQQRAAIYLRLLSGFYMEGFAVQYCHFDSDQTQVVGIVFIHSQL